MLKRFKILISSVIINEVHKILRVVEGKTLSIYLYFV